MARFLSSVAERFTRNRGQSREELVSERKTNMQITQKMELEANKDRNITKILMLGAGESGKSTLLKSMLYLFLHSRMYPEYELIKSRDAIQNNIIDVLVNAGMQATTFGLEHSEVCQQFMKHFDNYHRDDALSLSPPEMRLLLAVASDRVIEETLSRPDEWSATLMDNYRYFLDERVRILTEDYLPSFDDFIRSRQRTTGVMSYLFQYAGKNGRVSKYRITDVGGQQTERKKWIHAFDDVTLVIFVCALSGYNQRVFEDASRNRLRESLDLFEAALSKPALANKNCIVFFNKLDIFLEKIQTIPFNCSGLFPEYTGHPHDGEGVKEFIQARLLASNRSKRRLLYFHATEATNPDNIEYVFAAVHDTITREALQVASLI